MLVSTTNLDTILYELSSAGLQLDLVTEKQTC